MCTEAVAGVKGRKQKSLMTAVGLGGHVTASQACPQHLAQRLPHGSRCPMKMYGTKKINERQVIGEVRSIIVQETGASV